MLRFTRRSEYGLMALAYLGQRAGEFGSVRVIVEELNIPKRLLAEVLKDLSKAGLVDSIRGPGGGYKLTSHPSQISLANVVEALEGPMHLSDCGAGSCSLTTSCLIQGGISRVGKEIRSVLQNHTLVDVTAQPQDTPALSV